ncbi:MAG: molybdopterin biosynthesis protein, partial [Eubacteriales bacterium]
IAVVAKSTFEASDKRPVLLKEGVDFLYVNTGEAMDAQFDCVIKIEDVVQTGHNELRIMKSAAPYQHVRPIGEDIVANELILPSKTTISPVDIGAILAGGKTEVNVYKKPVVGIIPTGSELVEPGKKAEKGQIIEYNSCIFSNYVQEWGGEAKRYPIVRDDIDKIKDSVLLALRECDVILISAGSSAGSRDYTRSVIEQIGEVLTHGLLMQPGKPAILGIAENKPVIGIPGYPVSACMVMEQIARPLIYSMTGRQCRPEAVLQAVLSKKIVSSVKFEEFVRVKLGFVEDKLIASPLGRGAGVIMSLVRADGILRIPINCEGYEAGKIVEVSLRKDIEDIQNTVVIIGSHDPLIDSLADLLRQSNSGLFVSSTHVGSLGGIMAIRRGEAHMGGVHLLDPLDGSYNVSYIKKYIPDRAIALLHVVSRTQGFMVAKGNPKNVSGFADLTKEGVRFVNRQKGSGTRLLLDYFLQKEHIDSDKIHGYDKEEFTHLSTAAAIAEGGADVALGIYSAACSFELDFIPVCEEQYDLAIPEKFLNTDKVKQLIETIKSDVFVNLARAMGGYDTSCTGIIQYIK